MMMKFIRTSVILSVLFLVICGGIYPLIVTAVAQIFPYQANGSMIEYQGAIVGSELIGQKNGNLAYFQGRPSAVDYNENTSIPKSGSSNLATVTPSGAVNAYEEAINDRVAVILAQNPDRSGVQIPEELYTMSASGLDPHISVDGALYQVPRISSLTGISEAELVLLIENHTEQPLLGVGQVNVLKLNIALSEMQ